MTDLTEIEEALASDEAAHINSIEPDDAHRWLRALLARVCALEAALEETVAMVRDARELVNKWGTNTAVDFSEKWDLADDLAKLDEFLQRHGGGGTE